ncbi:MAG: hypothetical protein NT039_01965 [Candidatus Berkelbacteria bacterium]|nr:hypothetical protein [Candidatus Berkelbacteria bacterium]
MNHNPWFRKSDWPSLTRAALFIFWALFVTGAVPAIVGGAHHFIGDMRSRDLDQEERESKDSGRWADSKIEDVKKLGPAYSPEMYFQDLAEFDQQGSGATGFLKTLFVNTALELTQSNIRQGFFTQDEFRRQAELYDAWLDSLHPGNDVTSAEVMKVVWCLVAFYLRSILVALLIYILRMKEEDEGVVRSILADRRRFALALFLWPKYVWWYPFDTVINHLRAEAELRRIGGLFRRLSEAERSLVRQVVKLPKAEFRTWVLGHRACFGPLYVRGLALGILGVVVCLLFATVFTRRVEAAERTPQTLVLVHDGPQAQQARADDGGSSNSGLSALLPNLPGLPTPLASGTIVMPKHKVPAREGERLEHIPLPIRLAAPHVRTPQTERNVWNEEASFARLPHAA